MASAPRPRQNAAFSSSLTTAIDARAEGLAELHRGDAAATGGAEHDQFVALGDPTAIDEADPPGEVRDPEPGGLGGGESFGHREGAVGEGEALLGERAVPADERRDAHDVVAEREPVDALAERGDDPGRLLPEVKGSGGVSG